MTKDEALKLALETLENNKQMHYYCEDTWYSCPQHEEGCANDSVGDECNCGADKANAEIDKVITAIKEALAQPEQTNTRPYYKIDELNAWANEKEKQAWRNAAIRVGEELSSVGPDGYYDMNAWQWLDWAMEQQPRGKNYLAQPEQEPVATVESVATVVSESGNQEVTMSWWHEPALPVGTKLYTTPPQRKPLTDDEAIKIVQGVVSTSVRPIGAVALGLLVLRASEAVHGIT